MVKHLLEGDFESGIAQLARFTVASGIEGGFAAYADGSSKIDIPSKGELEMRAAFKDDSYEAAMTGYGDYNSRRLMYRELTDEEASELSEKDPEVDLSDKRRTDVDIFIHTHPVRESGGLCERELLCPSNADLENWDEHVIYNPGMVAGVLVPAPKSRALLLWRRNPGELAVPRYQMLEGHETATRVIRVMRESGIRVATIDMTDTTDHAAYQERAYQAIDTLF